MSWTKRQFVNQAFEEIGLAAYTFDLQGNQLQSACRKLDAMMAKWNADGIRVGYPMPSSPEDTDLDTETTVPDAANEAIYTNLAIRIAPGFGKVVSKDTISCAKQSYTALISWLKTPPKRRFTPQTPAGAGSKYWRTDSDPFMPTPPPTVDTGDDDTLDFY